MADASQKPRRFWQIHLSTALVGVLCAGTLLWANFNARVVSGSVQKTIAGPPPISGPTHPIPVMQFNYRFGWPFSHEEWMAKAVEENAPLWREEEAQNYLNSTLGNGLFGMLAKDGLIPAELLWKNLSACGGIVFATMAGWEMALRRRN